jgi:hypothetical protein
MALTGSPWLLLPPDQCIFCHGGEHLATLAMNNRLVVCFVHRVYSCRSERKRIPNATLQSVRCVSLVSFHYLPTLSMRGTIAGALAAKPSHLCVRLAEKLVGGEGPSDEHGAALLMSNKAIVQLDCSTVINHHCPHANFQRLPWTGCNARNVLATGKQTVHARNCANEVANETGCQTNIPIPI